MDILAIHACRTATENKLTEPNQSPEESHQGPAVNEEETTQIPTSDVAPDPSGTEAQSNPYPQPQQPHPGHYPPTGQAAPQYGAPAAGAQPAAPADAAQYGAATPPAPEQENPLLPSLRLYLTSLKAIWKGATADAVQQPARAGAGHVQWITAFGANAIVAALVMVVTMFIQSLAVRRSLGDFGSLIGGPSFGTYVFTFFIIFLAVASWYVIRVLTIKWTLMSRPGSSSFLDAAQLVSVNAYVHAAILAPSLVLALMPGGFGVVVKTLAMLPLLAIAIVAELILYVGVNQTLRPTRSVMVPYALLTVAALTMFVILWLILSIMGAAAAFDAMQIPSVDSVF